ncbi:sterile alpha motif domain-containing protein 15-like isoform X1 [Entelurus aequoreus]|uniref:sterile alpha motif domain-containing protein 15-like isoform X1 n=2 Tax=Entelurus aequoreus TaxID=161455 RepID=UPI002B1DC334|nr:sterile alpha motif domain-containing protein 15-like isoform X1 [Entelurus aequoreus]XP_061900999.1 sterile alpha motif domain-containing protein 15-like isoform X1 [Entelurus aequoreus]
MADTPVDEDYAMPANQDEAQKNSEWPSASFHGNMDTPNLDFLQWTSEEVAGWIESKGFPQYKPCFTDNCITGRKLIFVDCVHMPRIGITDFKDMQAISTCVRELLGITQTLWSRSIADPPRDDIGLFLEMKSRTGVKTDQLTIQQLLDDICH